ncbi:MAG: hypothetical protein J5970_00040 [Bacilli bacterium]|nr:hypothetical protein [Bacilli bacterium]
MTFNYGYQNEYDFIELFNNKYLYELDQNSQNFLKDIFENEIDCDEKIISWKNRMVQKTDIFIKYKNIIKNISLKCGNSNSIHHESIQDFKEYLKKINIPFKLIEIYTNYHYGYKKNENGITDFSKILSSEEYKKIYQNDINKFNCFINKTRIIIDMIDRFIIKGRNSDYDVDVLLCGTTKDYVWIKKYDLYDLILSKRQIEYNSPHSACLTIGPKKRCIDSNKNIKDRYIVCIRWNFIKENIIEFKNSLDKA